MNLQGQMVALTGLSALYTLKRPVLQPERGPMGEDSALVVSSWKRYGHDRLYVSTAEGQRLGYLDKKTDLVVVDDEGDRARVERALGRGPAVPDLEYAVVIDRLAEDLGQRSAGASAAERAGHERAAAPVRSFLARVVGQHTDERAWRVGAQGERIVGKELEHLKHLGWEVIHDVPVGNRGANIDHVVVGPGGVFTVNSKYHWEGRVYCNGGAVYVNGHVTRYVPVAEHEARRASKLLSAAYGAHVPVQSLLAVVCSHRQVKKQPRGGDVLVLGPREARQHLERLPLRHSAEEVSRLAHLARRSTTWQ